MPEKPASANGDNGLVMRSRFLAVVLLASPALPGASLWRLTRSAHFEVYSQSDDASARRILGGFEQLRTFFLEQTALDLQHSPVRVMVFGSAAEYESYRLSPASDAYFAASEGRNYIVMAFPAASHFGIAAHEYAHLILHAAGARYPPWLDEGLAEFYSTIRATQHATELGGDLPGRLQSLRRRAWIPLADVLALPADSPRREERESAEMFYAESWALTEMLLRSAQYAARFQQLMAAVSLGEPSTEAVRRVYTKSPDEIARDLHAWIEQRRVVPLQLPAIELANIPADVSDVPPLTWRFLMADALLTAGALDRAESMYRDLRRDMPESGDISAALGTIAFRRGDSATARLEWKRALAQNIADPNICYRYAVLAEQAGSPPGDVRAALERAVALQPDFDDARYMLALLEKTAGDYAEAVQNLRAMKTVSASRAFTYWLAMADALNELGRRDDAKAAAQQAEEHAGTASERAHARLIAYLADTDLGVQFARDANGNEQMVTTRVPHAAQNWNPFIEIGDDLRRAEGTLREIDCAGEVTRFVIQSQAGLLRLAIQDPSRVQMRNAPSDFECGPQSSALRVKVEYAVVPNGDGLIRGMEFWSAAPDIKPPEQASRSKP